MSFTLHPNVYSTGDATSLLRMLEQVWVRDHTPGEGRVCIVSGFATYNGAVRFLEPGADLSGGRNTCHLLLDRDLRGECD